MLRVFVFLLIFLLAEDTNGVLKSNMRHVNAIEMTFGKENAVLSWIDDDFNASSHPIIKSLCDSLHIKCDFALVPDVDGEVYYFRDSVIYFVRKYEHDGFHFEMHPPHKGWYKSKSAGDYKGIDWVRNSMKKTKLVFDQYGINHSNAIVYPGNSGLNVEVRALASTLFDYGISSSGMSNLKGQSKFFLSRIFIDLSEHNTKSYYKKIIKKAVESGGWVILGTHGNEYISDLRTLDETTKSLPNLKEIINYACSLCPMKCVNEVFEERNYIFKD